MRILHYALGFPPYRSGGLTKFCMDLMLQQKREQHEVALLWPGRMKLINKKVCICSSRNQHDIDSYELVNPLPVPYDEGIVEIEAFIKSCDKDVFTMFLRTYKPDVIHVHTLMGLHKEFLEAAKEQKIRTVFTIHDFFSICPKVTMLRNGKICDQIEDCGACGQCNVTALSLKEIFLLQSPLYRVLKDSKIVRKLRRKHREQFFSDDSSMHLCTQAVTSKADDYQRLRQFYKSMITMFDVIHANSNVTKAAFSRIYGTEKTTVIPITHADVQNRKRRRSYSNETLRITYLGAQSEAKGFFLLKDALDKLWNVRKNFILNVSFDLAKRPPYMYSFGRYDYSQLDSIFEMTDVLVAPSIWYETFGYTVIEALSYGVPVIVSSNVGAKDIIMDGCGIVIHEITSDKLQRVLEGLTADTLSAMNEKILNEYTPMTIADLSREISARCYQRNMMK